MKVFYRELQNDGYTLRGIFNTPDNGKYERLAVMYHGYTGHNNETGFLFKQIASSLCDVGIACLRYDYMGSGDSDGWFEDQNFNTVMSDARAMLKDAYELNNQHNVIVMGFSMGGATAAKISSEFPELIEKLVLISPAGMMAEHSAAPFNAKDAKIVDDQYVDLGGYYLNKKFGESFKGVDLYAGCEKYTGPVLIVQGSADLAVEPKVSYKYTKYYPNWKYLLIMGATHGYTKVPYRKEINKEIVKFLEEK